MSDDIIKKLINELNESELRVIPLSDTDDGRYLLAVCKISEEEYQNYEKIKAEGQPEKTLMQAKKYLFRELADRMICALCGYETENCICHELPMESSFGYFYFSIIEDMLSIDKFADFVKQLEEEAKKGHKNIKNELLHVDTENCHLCSYYYTDCICKDFKEPGYFQIVYDLIKNNKIPDQLFHDQVGELKD